MSVDIAREPVGAAYRQLIDSALTHCSSFSLVWRDESAFDTAIAAALAPHLIREERTDSWPGTQLLEGQATVRHYALTDLSAALLKRAPGLFAWIGPDRAEDLAFYASDGQLWLGSVAHESHAWFGSASPPFEALRNAMPLVEILPADA